MTTRNRLKAIALTWRQSLTQMRFAALRVRLFRTSATTRYSDTTNWESLLDERRDERRAVPQQTSPEAEISMLLGEGDRFRTAPSRSRLGNTTVGR